MRRPSAQRRSTICACEFSSVPSPLHFLPSVSRERADRYLPSRSLTELDVLPECKNQHCCAEQQGQPIAKSRQTIVPGMIKVRRPELPFEVHRCFHWFGICGSCSCM